MRIWPENIHSLHDYLLGYRKLIPYVGYPLNRGEKYRPFFIIGSGRSGNTLLRRILASHSSLHIPPETYVLGSSIKLYRQNNSLKWKDLVYLILSQFEFHPEFETFNLQNLGSLARKLVGVPKEERSLALILNGFYQFHAGINSGARCRWGDKTPLNTFSLYRIHSVFPDAQFIHIIRDGCDVVSSYLKSGIYKTIEEAAERWVVSTKLASKFVKENRDSCINIRYEELVRDPSSKIIDICGFLSIKFEETMLQISNEASQSMGDVVMREHHANVTRPISESSIGKGRRALTLNEKQFLQHAIGHQLEIFRYDPI